MNDGAIIAILGYMDEYLFEPRLNWPPSEFYRQSYSRWAVNEILEIIMDNPFTPADSLVTEFLTKMSCYSCINDKSSSMFSIATDIAEDIQSLLNGDFNCRQSS